MKQPRIVRQLFDHPLAGIAFSMFVAAVIPLIFGWFFFCSLTAWCVSSRTATLLLPRI